jgi:hypothetical protein
VGGWRRWWPCSGSPTRRTRTSSSQVTHARKHAYTRMSHTHAQVYTHRYTHTHTGTNTQTQTQTRAGADRYTDIYTHMYSSCTNTYTHTINTTCAQRDIFYFSTNMHIRPMHTNTYNPFIFHLHQYLQHTQSQIHNTHATTQHPGSATFTHIHALFLATQTAWRRTNSRASSINERLGQFQTKDAAAHTQTHTRVREHRQEDRETDTGTHTGA